MRERIRVGGFVGCIGGKCGGCGDDANIQGLGELVPGLVAHPDDERFQLHTHVVG